MIYHQMISIDKSKTAHPCIKGIMYKKREYCRLTAWHTNGFRETQILNAIYINFSMWKKGNSKVGFPVAPSLRPSILPMPSPLWSSPLPPLLRAYLSNLYPGPFLSNLYLSSSHPLLCQYPFSFRHFKYVILIWSHVVLR